MKQAKAEALLRDVIDRLYRGGWDVWGLDDGSIQVGHLVAQKGDLKGFERFEGFEIPAKRHRPPKRQLRSIPPSRRPESIPDRPTG